MYTLFFIPIDNVFILLRFIDYGNTEVKKPEEILCLPQNIKKFQPSATKVPLLDTVNVANHQQNLDILKDALLGLNIQISFEVVNGEKRAKVFVDNKRVDFKFVDQNMNEEEALFKEMV